MSVESLAVILSFSAADIRYNSTMPTPTPNRDTTPEAESILIRLIQDKPAANRINDAVTASNRVAEQCKAAIRRRHHDCSEEDIKLRFIALNYGQEMADKVRAYLGKEK